MDHELTRRELLGAGLAGGVALSGLDWAQGLRGALAAAPTAGRLADIEHVVILIQENRSFDHYFGSYRGVRGFEDPKAQKLRDGSGLPVFAQPGYPAPGFGGHLYPFHLDTSANGECVHDITHDWGPQHRSWNGGAMDGFVREHLISEGPDHGPLTMGYHRRSDLAYYYALADGFTLCDRYFCSVIGPTDANQLYISAGSLDPDGKYGGPLVETVNRSPQTFGMLSLPTMPEQLRSRGISWKVYNGDPDQLAPVLADSPFPLFRQYFTDPELFANGIAPQFPTDLQSDAANGTLPQVSWVYTQQVISEHPPAPVEWGQVATDIVLRALTANPAVWAKTVLFITWDENGGFFDHVPPPVAPPGTPGEYLSVANLPAAAEGVAGPIGLGFRVPTLIVSPFTRGGFVCSGVFDHTSILRFIETRFGAEVPNLSAWRRATVGDLTSAFNFAAAPDPSLPPLPKPSLTDSRVLGSTCPLAPIGLAGGPVPAYPVPPNSMPAQEPGVARRPSGCPEPMRKRKRKKKRKKRRRHHKRKHH
jgi:phospholipase C